jgi:hypothetical protein
MVRKLRPINFAGIVAVACLLIAGCGSSSGTSGPTTSPNTVEDPVLLSDYETFDAAQFPVESLDTRDAVVHDVPAALLAGRADAGVAQVVAGYRIQVFASTDRDAALAFEESVKTWWDTLEPEAKDSLDVPEKLPVYNQFKQPLYRVRIGDFTLRSRAEELMSAMAGSFDTVFVVPDQVTVYR